MRPPALAVALVGLAAIGAFLCYRGTFYQTGAQYYDVCWEKNHAGGKQPTSPQQAADWATCDNTADNAIYGAGFVFAGGTENTPALKALSEACPSAFTAPSYAVELIEDTGGPRLLDKFVPASVIIQRVFRDRYPSCTGVVAVNGFPHLVKRAGQWVWASPCLPCQAEQKTLQAAEAIAHRQPQNDAKDATFDVDSALSDSELFEKVRQYCTDAELASNKNSINVWLALKESPEEAARDAHCAHAPPRPYECGNLSDEDCADLLKREGKNPFDAFRGTAN